MPRTKSLATATSARHSTVERSTPKANRVSRASKDSVHSRVGDMHPAGGRNAKFAVGAGRDSAVRGGAGGGGGEVWRFFGAKCWAAAPAPRVATVRNIKMRFSVRQPPQGRICTLR